MEEEIQVEMEKLDEADKEIDEIVVEMEETATNNNISSMEVCFDSVQIEDEAETILQTENVVEGSSNPTGTRERRSKKKNDPQSPKPKHQTVKRDCKYGIISWKYEVDMKLFAVKRTDGI